jgi:hypothetical protein
MGLRYGWLFPSMVVAASTVVAFGCIRIAAIVGHLPLGTPGSGESARAVAETPAAAAPGKLARRTVPDESSTKRQ